MCQTQHRCAYHYLACAMFCLALGTVSRATAAETAQVDVAIEDRTIRVPDSFTMRARVTAIKPEGPVGIAWRHGGEGLGGEVLRGVLSEKAEIRQWSQPVAVATFVKGAFPGKLFLTITLAREMKRPAKGAPAAEPITGVEMEFEFAYSGKAIKTFKESGPDGATVDIVIPAYRLVANTKPDDPSFTDELAGLLTYASRRADMLEKLLWAGRPTPRKYAIFTDVAGYGPGVGYGIRTSNKAVVEAECRSLKQIGVNAFRAAPEYLVEQAYKGEGAGKDFNRARISHAMGYPVPAYREGRKAEPDAGCPFGTGIAKQTEEGVKASLDEMLAIPLPEVWGLTVDEIGAVVDRSPEGKGHYSVCPKCAEAFRSWLKSQGLTPADFGQTDWAQVKPAELGKGSSLPRPSDRGAAMAAYYTRMFNNYASARLFSPLRDALAKANEVKRKALAGGAADSPEAKRPWAYSYALRGNTFLMKGHSLDFFDFYRNADNAFVYEMSNRGPQVWQWDSYLCDAGRTVSDKMGLRFGVYVKPHRGAPIQRALTAVSRNARMIYWYTYGPDWHKGDSFSQNPGALELASKAARILGGAEETLYESSWAAPAQVAVVKPRTSEIWMGMSDDPVYPAAWENAKWTYAALTHAHIPVDAIDEVMLATEDLSRYKIIYVSGPNVTRAAAAALEKYVRAGGALYTSGRGLARDEAGQPLTAMDAVLGLAGRSAAEMYCRVPLYGATSLEPLTTAKNALAPPPQGAAISPTAEGKNFATALAPIVGREKLMPVPSATTLARFADGGAAMMVSQCDKGKAYTVGFFPALEYSVAARREDFDMEKDFDAAKRAFIAAPALALIQPVVETGQPTVEGVLLKNDRTGKLAVTLMNWTYRVAGQKINGKRTSAITSLVPFADLKIAVRGTGAASKARSVWLDKPLDVRKEGGLLTVTLPSLEEGDVLLLE